MLMPCSIHINYKNYSVSDQKYTIGIALNSKTALPKAGNYPKLELRSTKAKIHVYVFGIFSRF